ncbi:type VI secretion system lipoprotein TssJ [Pseudomonas alabamensis]|uniref:type VI secretion system lipoprotein TssJ n=1 Tax=Pseudomonas alabamensis TaxID=3064349 RepID=UPI003F651415
MNATRLAAALAVILLGACSSAPPVAQQALSPELTRVDLRFMADTDLNPGIDGVPAPVRVRLYELKNEGAFMRADYFALTDQAQVTLGADLLDIDDVLLQPGARLQVQRVLNPATRQIGLVVGYRDIDRAQWRQVLHVPPRDHYISLEARAVRSNVVTPQSASASRQVE